MAQCFKRSLPSPATHEPTKPTSTSSNCQQWLCSGTMTTSPNCMLCMPNSYFLFRWQPNPHTQPRGCSRLNMWTTQKQKSQRNIQNMLIRLAGIIPQTEDLHKQSPKPPTGLLTHTQQNQERSNPTHHTTP